MTKPLKARGIALFALKFLAFVGPCLMVWWLVLPYYARALGALTGIGLKYVLNVPVEGVEVNNADPDAILNTGLQIIFLIKHREPARLPELAGLVTNIAPYVALVLATPGLALARRVRIIGAGAGILAACHLVFMVMAYRVGMTEISMALAQLFITLPFLLWIVLAYRDEIGAFFAEVDSQPQTRDTEGARDNVANGEVQAAENDAPAGREQSPDGSGDAGPE